MEKYFVFRNVLAKENKRLDLSRRERELLDMVAKSHFSRTQIFVGNLLQQKQFASQATIHALLKQLMAKKLIRTDNHSIDGRIKIVRLSNLAVTSYKKLESAIKKTLVT